MTGQPSQSGPTDETGSGKDFLLKSKYFAHPRLVAEASKAGFLEPSHAFHCYILFSVIASMKNRDDDNSYFKERVRIIADKLGVSPGSLRSIVARSQKIYRAGSQGQRGRPWIVRGLNDEDAQNFTWTKQSRRNPECGGSAHPDAAIGNNNSQRCDTSSAAERCNPQGKVLGQKETETENRDREDHFPSPSLFLEPPENSHTAKSSSGQSSQDEFLNDEYVESFTIPEEGSADRWRLIQHPDGHSYFRVHDAHTIVLDNGLTVVQKTFDGVKGWLSSLGNIYLLKRPQKSTGPFDLVFTPELDTSSPEEEADEPCQQIAAIQNPSDLKFCFYSLLKRLGRKPPRQPPGNRNMDDEMADECLKLCLEELGPDGFIYADDWLRWYGRRLSKKEKMASQDSYLTTFKKTFFDYVHDMYAETE